MAAAAEAQGVRIVHDEGIEPLGATGEAPAPTPRERDAAALAGAAPGAKLDLLRERIRKLQAAPRRYLAVLRTGLPQVDALLPQGGLPLGQAVELWGEAASGRTSLALRAVAAAHRENRLAAWVDGPRELYPPAAAAVGADLRRLLIVRPKAPKQLVWTAQQLARSGAFACVVLDLTHTGVRLSLPESRKLQDAAVHGGTLLALLTPPDAPGEGALRLQLTPEPAPGPADPAGRFTVEILRSRGGGMGARAGVPYSRLIPGGAPPVWPLAPDAPLPAAPLTPDGRGPHEAPFRRVRTSELRNGGRGIYGQRPGRDTRMPALGASLGAGG